MAKFKVMVKDGQGEQLQCGAPKQAMKQARAILRCKKGDITAINCTGLEGHDCVYLFNEKDADADYWLIALKLNKDEPCYIGKVDA